jgi:hypothetical protein
MSHGKYAYVKIPPSHPKGLAVMRQVEVVDEPPADKSSSADEERPIKMRLTRRRWTKQQVDTLKEMLTQPSEYMRTSPGFWRENHRAAAIGGDRSADAAASKVRDMLDKGQLRLLPNQGYEVPECQEEEFYDVDDFFDMEEDKEDELVTVFSELGALMRHADLLGAECRRCMTDLERTCLQGEQVIRRTKKCEDKIEKKRRRYFAIAAEEENGDFDAARQDYNMAVDELAELQTETRQLDHQYADRVGANNLAQRRLKECDERINSLISQGSETARKRAKVTPPEMSQ